MRESLARMAVFGIAVLIVLLSLAVAAVQQQRALLVP